MASTGSQLHGDTYDEGVDYWCNALLWSRWVLNWTRLPYGHDLLSGRLKCNICNFTMNMSAAQRLLVTVVFFVKSMSVLVITLLDVTRWLQYLYYFSLLGCVPNFKLHDNYVPCLPKVRPLWFCPQVPQLALYELKIKVIETVSSTSFVQKRRIVILTS